MAKITIIHLIIGLEPHGAENMLYKLLRGKDETQFESYVISITDEGFYGDKIKALGIPVYTLGMKKNPLSIIAAVWRYNALLKNLQPDIVQTWMYHANALGALVAMFLPRQHYDLVWNIRHSPGDMSLEKKTMRWLIKLNAKLSSKPIAIINNSQTSQQQHQALGFQAQRDVIIGNGFDLTTCKPDQDQYYTFRREHDLEPSTKLVGNLARYHPMKNHQGLLALFSYIRQQYPEPIKLVLGGFHVNSQNQDLMRDIQQMGLQEDCLLLGFVETHQVMPVFDLYVSTSLWGEGFPNVLGEAMACGVPCAASDVGDCRYLLTEYGEVFEPNEDKEQVASLCIEQLTKSSHNKQRLRQYIKNNYSIEQIVQQYQKLYQQLDKD